jgi:hypothetical protein
MGSKVSMPTPPPAPRQIDPGQSALDFTRAMADPVLQGQILASEQMYRPQYTQLELSDINTILQGGGGQMGLLGLQDLASRQAAGIGQELTSAQRAADIADVEALGGRATAALRAADPMQQAIVNQLNALAADRYAASGQLSPQEMRGAQQAARLGGLSRGRVGDVSTVASEVLNREQALAARRQEALQAAQMAFAANQATAADPFQAILGRPAQAPGMGMASTQFAAGLAGQPLGPNLFDPNAGINLALQQNANQANYQSSLYGAQAGYAGATNQGRGAMIGGIIGGLGALGGGALAGCWVAREVFGNENPMWLLFRQWLFENSPDWFFNLYIKHGEKFAQFISDKPLIKRAIRKWMTGIVERKFAANPAFI